MDLLPIKPGSVQSLRGNHGLHVTGCHTADKTSRRMFNLLPRLFLTGFERARNCQSMIRDSRARVTLSLRLWMLQMLGKTLYAMKTIR